MQGRAKPILHLEDWFDANKKRTAVVQIDTTNASFVRMAYLLKKMGIQNNLFHLSLLDPKLLKVDPHNLNDENDPTQELRLRVAVECKLNPWYFFREVIRIPAQGGSPVPFKLHRGNLAMLWCFLSNINFTSTQPRQSGKESHLNSLIKIPGGWKKMGDMQVGDIVTAADGSPTEVLGVYPQGVKDIYRLTFEDGRVSDVGLEHLWKIHDDKGTDRIVETSDILAHYHENDTRWSVPTVVSEKIADRALPCGPKAYAESLDVDDDVEDCYLNASTSQRLGLLTGLLNLHTPDDITAPHASIARNEVQAKRIQEMVWSLGGICHRSGRIILITQFDINGGLKLPIVGVEYVSTEEAQCIEVAHPDHLYVMDDYIVTHNTICAVSICCYVLYIAGYTMDVAMLTHNSDIVQANVKRVKDIRESLPAYLIQKTTDDLDNKEGLYYSRLNNKYMTYVGQKDRRAANNVGRGATAPFIHGDETAFIANIDRTFPTIMASTNTAKANAKMFGQYHANIFTTTAGDPSTLEGKYMFDYISKAMKFTEKLYDTKDNDSAHELVGKNSTNNLVNGTFSYLQLGYSHAWFRKTVNDLNLAQSEVARDFLNQWVSMAEHPILPKDITDRMYATIKNDPLFVDVRGDYVINWYVPRETVLRGEWRKRPLIMGTDTSEMIGKDFTTCVAVDPTTLSVIFTFRCNESNTAKLAMFIADLLSEYREIVWVPERKSTAIPIIDKVLLVMQSQGQNPFKRIYNRIVDNLDLEEYQRFDINDVTLGKEETARRFIGFMTSGKTRPVLYKQVLQKTAHLACDRLYDRELIQEITSLQARNGRMDHSTQGNDDMVMALLLAMYLIFEGKNLNFYGLDPSTFLRTIESNDPKADPVHLQNQMVLRSRIRALIARAKMTSDPFIKKTIFYELEQLTPKLDESVKLDPMSTDAMRTDSFDYRSIRTEINNAVKNPSYTPGQVFGALFNRQ